MTSNIKIKKVLPLLLMVASGCAHTQRLPAVGGDRRALDLGFATVLYILGSERYAQDTRSSKQVILAVHESGDASDILKHSDGVWTVISIPVITEEALEGFCKYASVYNTWNMRKADLMVQAKDYTGAHRIYSLLAHFDSCGNLAEELKSRILVLERLGRGEVVSAGDMKLFEEYNRLAPFTAAEIADTATEFTKNLLDVEQPQVRLDRPKP